jgi:hypothetical protein
LVGKIYLLFIVSQDLFLNLDEHERRCNGQFIKMKGPENEKTSKNKIHSLVEPSAKKSENTICCSIYFGQLFY